MLHTTTTIARSLVPTLCAALLLLCFGCSAKTQFKIDNDYKGNVPQISAKQEPVLVRAVVADFLDQDAEKVGYVGKSLIGLEAVRHGWGGQFKKLTLDSFSKAGFAPATDDTALKSIDDVEALLPAAQAKGARYVVIARAKIERDDISQDHAANIGKALIPLAGRFLDKTASTSMKLSNRFIVFDVREGKVVLDKAYAEEDAKNFSFQDTKFNEVLLQTRIDMIASLENRMLNAFWNDLSNQL